MRKKTINAVKKHGTSYLGWMSDDPKHRYFGAKGIAEFRRALRALIAEQETAPDPLCNALVGYAQTYFEWHENRPAFNRKKTATHKFSPQKFRHILSEFIKEN